MNFRVVNLNANMVNVNKKSYKQLVKFNVCAWLQRNDN